MFSRDFPWATFGLMVLTTVVAVVGGAVVIWGHPGALSFEEYLNDLWKFAAAIGVLSVGRGIKAGLENHGAVASGLSDTSLLSELPDLGGGAGITIPAAPAAADVAQPVEIIGADGGGHV